MSAARNASTGQREDESMTTRTRSQAILGLDRPALLRAHRLMVLARTLDETERRLKRQQKTYFQISGAGHEAIQAAACLLLKPGHDWFYP
jgi:2-oxoisovalerate dehydrogenase E1 component